MPPSLEKLILGDILKNSNQFTGGIPTEWGSLTKLKELNMAKCGLDGTLVSDPRYTGEREERTGERASSGTESAHGCSCRVLPRCAGVIPESIGNLKSLRELQLQGNALSGA